MTHKQTELAEVLPGFGNRPVNSHTLDEAVTAQEHA